MFWAEEFILDKPFVLELCAGHPRLRARADAGSATAGSTRSTRRCWPPSGGRAAGTSPTASSPGARPILEAVRKQTTLEQIERAVAAREARPGCRSPGTSSSASPRTPRATMRATERFVDSLDLDFVQYYCAMPYPGTELYAAARSTAGSPRATGRGGSTTARC